MEIQFIPGEEINSELGVVNAARVSLNKKSLDFTEADKKLINYLASHNHWTPFAHSRLYFQFTRFSGNERLFFYENANLSGFSLQKIERSWYLKGSLYAFLTNLRAFKDHTKMEYIADWLLKLYPYSTRAVLGDDIPYFTYHAQVSSIHENWIRNYARTKPELYNLVSATLLVKVPIFIARQIRTSQIGFFYSDAYVESEAFVFNEISRRYVNTEPEFYEIPQWRVREGKGIKQGSTGLADEHLDHLCRDEQYCHEVYSKDSYKKLMNYSIAPEQARALLPQSMYTEFYMTGSLHRWVQFLSLRFGNDVQEETRVAARFMKQTLSTHFPYWADYYWRS